MTPDKLNVAFDKQQIKVFRELVDANSDTPYEKFPFYINWLWFSQAVAAMEAGINE